MRKQDARSLHPEAQETLRLRIADFLKEHKGTQKEAADIFQVSLRAVEKIWKQFKEGGRKALKQKKRSPHKNRHLLSDSKAKQIGNIIKADTPEQHHIPCYLWTAAAVRLLIKKSSRNLQCPLHKKAVEAMGLYFSKASLQRL
ncbi:MAG: helix-turn-helix domain-containing protein [Flavisolibacter sp.]|nr:helix-turn-helix domain-containing protein [Flavisolibacter sp.]MBD0364675.1 helix-turn-helix domain-containing protein [Flavisolibacter sp.]MBD0377648.1 helix-turn-helix domain-containing protein [Flavisolibacter sp.]